VKILGSLTNQQSSSLLDLGCGSGILSFLFAKQFKKAKIYAIDKNKDAVKTCNLNAAELGLGNV
jgi:methylase of polypeptide subunit release factors